MSEGRKKLTLLEASSVVAGLGIGGGVMATPYLASLNGIVPIICIVLLAYLISVLFHLMIAEMVIRDGADLQLVELFAKYLFHGRAGALFTWIFFSSIVIGFYSLLAGYIVGCGEVMVKLFTPTDLGMPLWAGEILTYLVAAGVIFFGVKGLGVGEKYAVVGILIILVVLAAGSFGRPFKTVPLFTTGYKQALALYGIAMFSFAVFFSIPQAVEGLSWNKKMVPWAITIGLGITLLCVLVITSMAILVSKHVTEVALIGWGEAVGNWHLALGSAFGFLAMLTSYWSVSYALAVIVKERVNWGDRASWLVATMPTVLLAVTGVTGFLGFMRIVGGSMAVLVAVLIIPAYRISRRQGLEQEHGFSLGFWGNSFFQLVVLIAYLVMAIGSMVHPD